MTLPLKRGGQPHNRNALKHGFYARQFNPVDLADLAKIDDPSGLDAEIDLMRVTMRRLVESSRGLTDFESLSRLAHAVTFVSLAFTRLMHTRYLIAGKPNKMNELADEIHQALIELSSELPPEKPSSPTASDPSRPDLASS